MATSLFFLKDPQAGISFGIKPYSDKCWTTYYTLRRRISLKDDLGWREMEHFQHILCGADMWTSFPAVGLTLVDAEFKGGDEDQRIDLLYLRDDGGLLPCELKIGGTSKDTHGQLIRYMADLGFQKLDMAFLTQRREHFISKFTDSVTIHVHTEKFTKFIEEYQITDKFIRLLPQAGILIDEGFPSQLVKAVRFLNHSCGFAIRMLRVEAFVADDWTPESTEYFMRLDFIDIQ
ncbi:MAG: hypothetical protein L3J17_08465 [Candidatus Jettenia sp.]|nr:MAG: hypothetical protein L3J17_08465 [Candidatus Jettenia sp.]